MWLEFLEEQDIIESIGKYFLTLSWRGPLLYRNKSIDLQSKSVDWFLSDNGLRHERVNRKDVFLSILCQFPLNFFGYNNI